MAIVADLSVSPDSFAPGRALSAAPDVVVELEEIVPTEDRTAPYFWVRGDPDGFEDAVAADDDVDSLERVVTLEETALFRTTWTGPIPDLIAYVAEADATVLRGTGREREWLFTLRFPDDDALSSFHANCAESGLSFDVQRLKHLETATSRLYGLTEKQREALVTALREGYFEVPRRTNQESLARELDVSDSAVSELLRRGTARLVGEALVGGDQETAVAGPQMPDPDRA